MSVDHLLQNAFTGQYVSVRIDLVFCKKDVIELITGSELRSLIGFPETCLTNRFSPTDLAEYCLLVSLKL